MSRTFYCSGRRTAKKGKKSCWQSKTADSQSFPIRFRADLGRVRWSELLTSVATFLCSQKKFLVVWTNVELGCRLPYLESQNAVPVFYFYFNFLIANDRGEPSPPNIISTHNRSLEKEAASMKTFWHLFSLWHGQKRWGKQKTSINEHKEHRKLLPQHQSASSGSNSEQAQFFSPTLF